MGIIFDLDQTLIDSSIADGHRQKRMWGDVYRLIGDFKIYEGILDAFDYCRQNKLKVCIVTSSPSTYCQKVLNHWRLSPDYTVCYHDTANRKPHPDPIHKAVSLLNANCSSVLSFGDRDIDIIASRAANVKSVGCGWGCSNVRELQDANPDYFLSASSEIIPTIKNYFSLPDFYRPPEPF